MLVLQKRLYACLLGFFGATAFASGRVRGCSNCSQHASPSLLGSKLRELSTCLTHTPPLCWKRSIISALLRITVITIITFSPISTITTVFTIIIITFEHKACCYCCYCYHGYSNTAIIFIIILSIATMIIIILNTEIALNALAIVASTWQILLDISRGISSISVFLRHIIRILASQSVAACITGFQGCLAKSQQSKDKSVCLGD